MPETPYFGTYVRFDTDDKREAAQLLGADNLAGDCYQLEIVTEGDTTRVWLVSRFNKRIGFLDERGTEQAQLCLARGWKTQAYLSVVCYTEEPKPGFYWGEVALIGYSSKLDDIMEPFLANLKKHLSEGIRPQVDLGAGAIADLEKSGGTWFPKGRVKMPKEGNGTSIVKNQLSFNDKLVEQSRKGNIGCLILGWGCIFACVGLIAFGLHSCGVF